MASDQLLSSNPLGEPSFFILLSLAGGPRHGYAVLKDVEEVSRGRVTLSVSTLYTTLGRLQEQGLIERSDDGDEEPSPGLPRKVYRLTNQGQGALSREATRLREMLTAYHVRFGEEGR
jgi:PadR family transcriptional regulator, regulatory protein PadR